MSQAPEHPEPSLAALLPGAMVGLLVALARNVLDGLDLAGVARGVIDELDLTELIRESTGTVTVEAVDALRLGGMSADRMVSRVVDRLLMRKGERAPNGAVATSSAG